MRNPNFDYVDIEGLGKFKVGESREILNLIGYLVLPELLDDRRVVVDTRYPIAFFVMYTSDKRPCLGFRGNREDLLSKYYSDYNELDREDKTIIESNRNSNLNNEMDRVKFVRGLDDDYYPNYDLVGQAVRDTIDNIESEQKLLFVDWGSTKNLLKWPDNDKIMNYLFSSPEDLIEVVEKDILE